MPDEVVIESLVRAKNIEVTEDASKKVDMAFKSGAMAIGCEIEINTMPVLKFATGGVEGGVNSEYFKVVDEEIAYIVTAKIMALTAYRLLKEKAKEARKIKSEFKAKFTVHEYKKHMDKFEAIFKTDYKNE